MTTSLPRRAVLAGAAGLVAAPRASGPAAQSVQLPTALEVSTVSDGLDRLRGVTARFYGSSIPNWPDRWSYRRRLADLLSWDVTNCSVGGERAIDTAARVIGAQSPHQWKTGAAHIVVVDCSTNTMFGSGLRGATDYRNSLRAICSYISLEGPMDDQDVTYSGSWTVEPSGDRHRGGGRYGGDLITLPGFDRAGRWAFGYGGIADTLGLGSTFDILADGVVVGRLDSNDAVRPTPLNQFGSSNPRTRGNVATVVDLPTPVHQFQLRRTNGGGGPWFDFYGHINETPSAPLIVLPEPIYYPDTAYALPGSAASNEVVDAYTQITHEVAAEIGANVLVVDTHTGWDRNGFLRRSDPMHPNARGHAHLARAITNALAATDWWPYTD